MTQAPEIQTMYSVSLPVSVIRTRMRQEFERHRYVNKLPVVDVLIFQSSAEYQVATPEHMAEKPSGASMLTWAQEMMNFWKQTTHVMSYFKDENFRGDRRLPSNFMEGFIEAFLRPRSKPNREHELTSFQGRN